MLPTADPAENPETTLFDFIGENEIPIPIFDDIVGLGKATAAALLRLIAD